MFGKVVTTKGICIVEHEGERLYLDRQQAQGFQIGQVIEFEEIASAPSIKDSGLRQITRVKTQPPSVELLFEPETLEDEIPWLLKKHGIVERTIRDLTRLNTFSIDPEGSKDLDDALSFTEDRVYVHIPYFELPKDIEAHARERQFSIYLHGNFTEHLLPLDLSIDRYSLLQDRLRLTWTVEFDSEMNFKNLYLAHIINKHQLSYSEATEKLELLQKPYQIFQRFHQPRAQIPTYEYRIQENRLLEIKERNHLESHSLIEFYMVRANSAVAEYLQQRKILFPRRAHDLSTKAAQDLSAYTPEIQNYLRVISSPPAYYTTSEKGHGDLKLKDYTHFTSPIRRYIDQVISQLLSGKFFTKAELNEICTQANAQERRIDSMNEEYLSRRIQEYLKEHSAHQGIITFISKWGIHVSFLHLRMKAELHVSKLNSGRLEFVDGALVSTTRTFRLGDKFTLYARFTPELEWSI